MHVSGKNLVAADILSRLPAGNPEADETSLESEVEACVSTVVQSLSVSDIKQKEIAAFR